MDRNGVVLGLFGFSEDEYPYTSRYLLRRWDWGGCSGGCQESPVIPSEEAPGGVGFQLFCISGGSIGVMSCPVFFLSRYFVQVLLESTAAAVFWCTDRFA